MSWIGPPSCHAIYGRDLTFLFGGIRERRTQSKSPDSAWATSNANQTTMLAAVIVDVIFHHRATVSFVRGQPCSIETADSSGSVERSDGRVDVRERMMRIQILFGRLKGKARASYGRGVSLPRSTRDETLFLLTIPCYSSFFSFPTNMQDRSRQICSVAGTWTTTRRTIKMADSTCPK